MNTFTCIQHAPLDSLAGRALTLGARCLYFDFIRAWSLETRNGRHTIPYLPFVWTYSSCPVQEGTWNAHRAELEQSGFIEAVHRKQGLYRLSNAWEDRLPTAERQVKVARIEAAKRKRQARSAEFRRATHPPQKHPDCCKAIPSDPERSPAIPGDQVHFTGNTGLAPDMSIKKQRTELSKSNGFPNTQYVVLDKRGGSGIAACKSKSIPLTQPSPEVSARLESSDKITRALGLNTPAHIAAVRNACLKAESIAYAWSVCAELKEELHELSPTELVRRFKFRATHSPEDRLARYAAKTAENAQKSPWARHSPDLAEDEELATPEDLRAALHRVGVRPQNPATHPTESPAKNKTLKKCQSVGDVLRDILNS